MICYDILNELEAHGFEAYIVGGFVRDNVLGRLSVDADIITNASPFEVISIFNKYVVKVYEKYGAVKIKINNKIFDITTYRKELSYNNGKPNNILFIRDVKEDLVRRDFSINTLCMDKEGNIVDYLGVMDDFKIKIIKTVRDTNLVLREDPSRIIRALRFYSEFDFSLDSSIHKYILENKSEISKISYTKRKQELDKLFSSGNSIKFFNYIKKYELEEYLGISVNSYVEVKSSFGVWAQLEVDSNYNFSKSEKLKINNIRTLLNKGIIEKYDIYKYGLDVSLIVASILNIDVDKIKFLYTNIKIKSIIDINITGGEICSILNIKPSKLISEYLEKLEVEIVNGRLDNSYQEIVNKLKEWGVKNE